MIDRLEALVNSGTRVPLTSKALVDEQEFLELVDQLRVAVPEEVRHAKRVSQDRERVLSQANTEADKLVAAAQEQASQLVQEHDIVRVARQQAEEILTHSVDEAKRLRGEADTYALGVLEGLENELNRLLATVRKGKAALDKMGQEGRLLEPESSRSPASSSVRIGRGDSTGSKNS